MKILRYPNYSNFLFEKLILSFFHFFSFFLATLQLPKSADSRKVLLSTPNYKLAKSMVQYYLNLKYWTIPVDFEALLTFWNQPRKSSKIAHFGTFFELCEVAGEKQHGRRGHKHKLALPIPHINSQKKFGDNRIWSLGLLTLWRTLR